MKAYATNFKLYSDNFNYKADATLEEFSQALLTHCLTKKTDKVNVTELMRPTLSL